MLSVALVGAGWHSLTHHAPALQQFCQEHPGKVRLAAVCDLDATKRDDACARFGFERCFGDFTEMLPQLSLDAAVVVLPVPLMASATRTFLDHSIAVLIEKPLGVDIQEARSLRDATAQARTMVSLNRRFDPGLKLALQWIRQHGPVRVVHGTMLRVKRVEPQFIWSTGIHLLDTLCVIAGPLQATGVDSSVPGRQPNIWRLAKLDSTDGPAVSVEIMPSCGRMEERVRLAGDSFCVDVWTGTNHPWRVEAYHEGKLELVEESPADQAEHLRNGTYDETVAFLNALLQNKPLPGPNIDDAMPSSELAWQLHTQQTCDPLAQDEYENQ